MQLFTENQVHNEERKNTQNRNRWQILLYNLLWSVQKVRCSEIIDFCLDFQLPICVMRYFPVSWFVRSFVFVCVKYMSNQYSESWRVNDLISHNARERLCQFSNAAATKKRTPLAFIWFSFLSIHLSDIMLHATKKECCCTKQQKYIYLYVICPSLRIFVLKFKRDKQKRSYYECLHLYRLFLHTLRQWVLLVWS